MGAKCRCCVCGTESKLYRLYKTTRDWEAEYDVRDQCYKKRKRRCMNCELVERCEEDVEQFYSIYDIKWEGAENGFERPEKLKLRDLNDEDLKRLENTETEIYDNGVTKVVKRDYFTLKGVERNVKHQGRTQNWHSDGQSCAKAMREVNESKAARNLIMVNKAEVQQMVTSDELEPGQFKIKQASDGGGHTVIVHASMREQLRAVTNLLPLHTLEDIKSWTWGEEKKATDLMLCSVKYQEKEDDDWCDRRRCLRCKCLKFKTKDQEAMHRMSMEHTQMLLAIPNEEYHCPLCSESFKGKKSKELLLRHLHTTEHQEQVAKTRLKIARVGDEENVVVAQYDIAIRYVKAKYLVHARIMVSGLLTAAFST